MTPAAPTTSAERSSNSEPKCELTCQVAMLTAGTPQPDHPAAAVENVERATFAATHAGGTLHVEVPLELRSLASAEVQ